jgi:hypothetical protein
MEFMQQTSFLVIQTPAGIVAYMNRQWIRKEGVDSFSVYDRRHRTNNAIESLHASLARYLKVSHPNIFAFLGNNKRKLSKLTPTPHKFATYLTQP